MVWLVKSEDLDVDEDKGMDKKRERGRERQFKGLSVLEAFTTLANWDDTQGQRRQYNDEWEQISGTNSLALERSSI